MLALRDILMNGELLFSVKDVHVNHANNATYQETDGSDRKAEVYTVETDSLIGGTQLVDGTKVQCLTRSLSVTHGQ